jgi:hypothetical protein
MIELISAVLFVVGVLIMSLGTLKYVLNREREKATIILVDFLIKNHKPSKD